MGRSGANWRSTSSLLSLWLDRLRWWTAVVTNLDFVSDNFGDLGLVDPGGANQTSSVEGVSVMLPFLGLTELPVLAAGMGNFTIADDERRITFGTGVYAPSCWG